MKTIRRDVLLRKAKAGKLVRVESYQFDDMYGESRTEAGKDGAVEIPVRICDGARDCKEGYCNLTEFEFGTKSGAAWRNENGTITMVVHSNMSYTFREVDNNGK